MQNKFTATVFIIFFWVIVISILTYAKVPYNIGGESLTVESANIENGLNFVYSAATFNIYNLNWVLRLLLNCFAWLSVIIVVAFVRG